jgi:small subunit ribosomal protein S17
MTRSQRRTVEGVVTSDKMQKTVVVVVERLVKHPVYKKTLRRRTKLMAHNENDEAKTGDRVELVETRKLSRNKSWRVARIVKKAPAPVQTVGLQSAVEASAAPKTKGQTSS